MWGDPLPVSEGARILSQESLDRYTPKAEGRSSIW